MAMMTYAALAKSLGLTLKPAAASTLSSTSVSMASQPHSEPLPRSNGISSTRSQWGSSSAPTAVLGVQEDQLRTEEAVDQPLTYSTNCNSATERPYIAPCWAGAEKRQYDPQAFATLEEGEIIDTEASTEPQLRSQFEAPRAQSLTDQDSDIASSRSSPPPTPSCRSNPPLMPSNLYCATPAAPSTAPAADPAPACKAKVEPPLLPCSSHPRSNRLMAKSRERTNADASSVSPEQDVRSPPLQPTSIPANVTPDIVGKNDREHNALRLDLDMEDYANSKEIECRNLTDEQLHHAKVLVLDLLGWGVTPEYLLQRGISLALLYTVFTDLQLRLPDGIIADCVALVAARRKDSTYQEAQVAESRLKTHA